jgi:hypothetical protein
MRITQIILSRDKRGVSLTVEVNGMNYRVFNSRDENCGDGDFFEVLDVEARLRDQFGIDVSGDA